jgi:hypothetical protein
LLAALQVISSSGSWLFDVPEYTLSLQEKFAQEGWSLEELHRTLGARITGVAADPSSFSPEQRTLLAAAFATYDLLLFPDQARPDALAFLSHHVDHSKAASRIVDCVCDNCNHVYYMPNYYVA